jgi:hypothetical protein
VDLDHRPVRGQDVIDAPGRADPVELDDLGGAVELDPRGLVLAIEDQIDRTVGALRAGAGAGADGFDGAEQAASSVARARPWNRRVMWSRF